MDSEFFFALTMIGVVIMIMALIVGFIFFFRFLGQTSYLLGFSGPTKIGEAHIVGFKTRHDRDTQRPLPATPVIEYYNEYLDKLVQKEMVASGLIRKSDLSAKKRDRGVDGTEILKIEYTAKKVRIIDERFIKDPNYKIFPYVCPILISLGFTVSGFIMLVIGILFD